jgi:prevent-host-death family protein
LLIYYVSRYIVNGSGIVAVIGIRDLANNTSAVVEQVARTGRPTLVTRRGHPVAALIAVDEDELLDHILANAPEYVRSVSLAQAEVAKGQRGRLLGEVVAELDSEA